MLECMLRIRQVLLLLVLNVPGDFVTNVTQINSQSNLILISSFACPSYAQLGPMST